MKKIRTFFYQNNLRNYGGTVFECRNHSNTGTGSRNQLSESSSNVQQQIKLLGKKRHTPEYQLRFKKPFRLEI